MIRLTRIAYFFLLTLFCSSAISAQQNTPPTGHPPGRIFLDVVVTEKSGPPLAGLRKEDFTLFDNKIPQTIASFRAVSAQDPGQSVILVVDGIDITFAEFAYARTETDKFLRAGGGHLAYPTALATLSFKGIQLEESFTTDGNALATALDRASVIWAFNLARFSGVDGTSNAFRSPYRRSTRLPRRWLHSRDGVIWLSPGWHVIPAARLNPRQQQQISGRPASISVTSWRPM